MEQPVADEISGGVRPAFTGAEMPIRKLTAVRLTGTMEAPTKEPAAATAGSSIGFDGQPLRRSG